MKSNPQRGPEMPIKAGWSKDVENRLKAKRWTYADLAREIGITRAAVGHILNKAQGSAYVLAIEAVVGMGRDNPATKKTAWTPLTDAERLVYAATFADAVLRTNWEFSAERAYSAVMELRKAEPADPADSRHAMLSLFRDGKLPGK